MDPMNTAATTHREVMTLAAVMFFVFSLAFLSVDLFRGVYSAASISRRLFRGGGRFFCVTSLSVTGLAARVGGNSLEADRFVLHLVLW